MRKICQTDCNSYLHSVHPPNTSVSYLTFTFQSVIIASLPLTPLKVNTGLHYLGLKRIWCGPGGKSMNILPGAYLQCAAKCHMLQVHPLIARCSVYSTAWH